MPGLTRHPAPHHPRSLAPSFRPFVGPPVAGGVDDVEDCQHSPVIVQRISDDVRQAMDGLFIGAADATGVAGGEIGEAVAGFLDRADDTFGSVRIVGGDVPQDGEIVVPRRIRPDDPPHRRAVR